MPVRVEKARQNKELVSDFIRTKQLTLEFGRGDLYGRAGFSDP